MLSKTAFLKTMAAAVMLATGAAPAAASQMDFSNLAFAPVTGLTSIPIGHSEFCKKHPEECAANTRVVEAMPLTEARWEQLVEVNTTINATIVPITDEDLYQVEELWTYPAGYGDCEDFVLAKRRQLLEYGWDPSTLLMAVVRQRNGDGHAVLMVRTDRGDLVLDNLDGMVRVWTETPYQYLKRQSQYNAGQWVDILDERVVVTAAAD